MVRATGSKTGEKRRPRRVDLLLSERDRAVFFDVLIRAPKANAQLRRAFRLAEGSIVFVRRRGHRKFVLTPAGEALYRYACDAINKSAELRRTLEVMKAAAPQTITLAVQRTIANLVLPGALAAFLHTRRDARISVHSETQEAALKLFETGKVDAAILFAAATSADREAIFLGLQRLAFVAAPDHPLAGRATIAIEELRAHDFVGGLPGSQFFGLIEAILRDIGLSQYRVVLHMQDFHRGQECSHATGWGSPARSSASRNPKFSRASSPSSTRRPCCPLSACRRWFRLPVKTRRSCANFCRSSPAVSANLAVRRT